MRVDFPSANDDASSADPFLVSTIMLTMTPPCSPNHWRNALRIIKKVPLRLVSTTARKPLAEMVSAAETNWPPALLTRKSKRPAQSSAALIAASQCASSLMLQTTGKTLG